VKNIVICSDGTNNQLTTAPTNVLRLFDSLDLRDPTKQVAYYDPGVGTLAHPGRTNPLTKRLSLVFGLAFGAGFTRNLETAYRFLMHYYQPGDRIFLFGFSRGAFTVRALAGMLHMFGLLRVEHENLLPYISRAYTSANFDVIKRTLPFTRRHIGIDFLGLWDSVSSLGFAYARKALPFTANNPSVYVIRHALAIDERRAYFRQNRWGRVFANKQDIKEVWFAGVHADVGGGYPEKEGGLSKISLEWMIEQACLAGVHSGLLIDPKAYQQELAGVSGDCKPDAGAPIHQSLNGPWWTLEFLPKNATLQRDDFLIPVARRRLIEGIAGYPVVVHQSVIARMNAHKEKYQPANLKQTQSVEAWTTQALTSPYLPTPLSKRLVEFFRASAWVIGCYYVLFSVIYLLGQLAVVLVKGVIHSETKPDWLFSLLDAVQWPRTVYAWSASADHAWSVLVWLFPFMVFAAGAWLQRKLSNIGSFSLRITDKLLHLRWQGYDALLAKKQFKELGDDGLRAYRLMLFFDMFLPFFYAPALAASLIEAFRLTKSSPIGLEQLCPWVLGLPLVTALADWLENTLLLRQIGRFQAHMDLRVSGVRAASVATIVKLTAFTASAMVLTLLIFLHLFRGGD